MKLQAGEIDLAARKGGVICFIEAKERGTRDGALGGVTRAAWRRISRAADVWMAQRPGMA